MPIFLFSNPKNGQVKEVHQGCHEKHTYSENGIEWVREWTKPTMGLMTKIDPMSGKDFVTKSAGMKGTIGDLFDMSQELAEKREKIMGKDTIKEQSDKEYSRKRKGKRRPNLNKNLTFEV